MKYGVVLPVWSRSLGRKGVRVRVPRSGFSTYYQWSPALGSQKRELSRACAFLAGYYLTVTAGLAAAVQLFDVDTTYGAVLCLGIRFRRHDN